MIFISSARFAGAGGRAAGEVTGRDAGGQVDLSAHRELLGLCAAQYDRKNRPV